MQFVDKWTAFWIKSSEEEGSETSINVMASLDGQLLWSIGKAIAICERNGKSAEGF